MTPLRVMIVGMALIALLCALLVYALAHNDTWMLILSIIGLLLAFFLTNFALTRKRKPKYFD